MRVHNYYSDILSRLYMFLNNDVLSMNNRIQHVQYNLGSASSILEYRDSYDLPSAVIKYETLEPWSSMPISPRTFQKTGGMFNNPSDRYTAIFNDTKGIDLDIQMQYFMLSSTVNINCKSQMQAINISHEITQRMPVDRMMNQFSFVSFFELDEIYLNPMVFDVQNDFITNLFLSVDPSTNVSSYSFSYTFNPLIRLMSTPQVSMDDSMKATYQLVINVELYIQVPQFMISEMLPGSSRSADRFQSMKTSAISTLTNPTSKLPCYYNYLYFDVDNGSVRDIIAVNSNLVDANNILTHNGNLSDGSSYSLTANYIGMNIHFNYTITYKGEILGGEGSLFVYNSGVSICRLSGDLYGNVLNPVFTETSPATLSGIMLGNYNGFVIDNEPMVFDVGWFRKRPALSSTQIVPSNWTLRHPATRDLYSITTNVNAYRSVLNFAQTTISSVSIITLSNDVITIANLTTPYILLPDGSFTFQIVAPVAMTVSGKFNKTTSFLDNIVSSDPLYDILTLDIAPTWDYLPYGSSQFDSVNFDLGGISNTSIPSTQEHDAFIRQVSKLDTSYVSIYSTLPYIAYHNQYSFSIIISSELTTLNPLEINKSFEIYFIHAGQFISSATSTSFMLDLNTSIPTELVFKATEDFRLRVLDNITKYSPLYFGIIILP